MKKLSLFLFIIYCNFALSQVISSSKWRDLFSYNNVLAIKEDGDRMIAATENGIFYYTPSTGEVEKLSKANGLHEVKISAFDYNPDTQIGLVGYTNGSLDVLTPDGVFLTVDIPIATSYTGSKAIKHISINGSQAVISVGYGVSIFNLDKKEFGDTCFFNSGGTYIAALESVIKDNTVYTVTASGLVSHELDVTFANYSTWSTDYSGSLIQIASDDAQMAFSSKTQVFYGSPNTFSTLGTTFTNVKDLSFSNGQILVTDQNSIYIFNSSGVLQNQTTYTETLNTGIEYQSSLFVGTTTSGILDANNQVLKPDGPYSNTSYKITLNGDQLWVASGGRGVFYDLVITNLGYYHFNGTEWIYPDYFKTNVSKYRFNILDVEPNPSNTNEVFFTNAINTGAAKAIFKMENDEFVKLYSNTASNAWYQVPISLAFDDNNALFATKQYALLDGGIGKNMVLSYFNRGSDVFNDYDQYIIQGPFDLKIYDQFIYMSGSRGGGLVINNYKGTVSSSDDNIKILNGDNNIPEDYEVYCVEKDLYGDLWIGSGNGLRVLSNPESAIDEDSPQAEPIIITQNGIAEELFTDNAVLSIAVDSGNQKWISVDGGGVFYLSSDGQTTIKHFTKANSPIPTNSVTDIKINQETGEVYFVTKDGIVVYQGDITDVTSDFGDVKVYPNPVVYDTYKGNVKLTGLAEKTNIRITDAAGNLVHQAVARGGYYEWDLNNNRGKRVASGIYFVLMTNEDATDKATAKIAVVN